MDELEKDTDESTGPNGPEEETWFQLIRSIVFIFIGVFAFKHSVLDANNIPSGSMVPTLKIGDYLFVNKMRYSFRLGISFWKVHLDYKVADYDNPKHGDIITFDPPNNENKTYVKRVIAVPGDDLKIVPRYVGKKNGVQHRVVDIYVNGELASKKIAHDRAVLSDLDMDPDAAQVSVHGRLYWEQTGDQTHHTLYNYSAEKQGFGDYGNCVVKKLSDPPKDNCAPIPEDSYFVMGDSRDQSSDSRMWNDPFVKRDSIYGKALIIYFSVNWRDKTCAYRDMSELYKEYDPTRKNIAGITKPYLRPKEEVDDYCYRDGNINEPAGASLEDISIGERVKIMLSHRIWRADVRWSRIGRIIH